MENLKKNYKVLIKQKGNYDKASITNETSFKATLVAAFSKYLEFNHHINCEASDKETFFLTPMLRGLCEELIVLKFILSKIDTKKDKLILELMFVETLKNIKAQDEFFKINKPFQPVVRRKKYDDIKESQNRIKEIVNSQGLNGDRLPSVEQLAQKTDLTELYQFLYRATSNFVHFNPGILLRMGWNKSGIGDFTFSTKNFYAYYSFFTRFYGTYLFIEFIKTFKNELELKKEFTSIIEKLEKEINKLVSWPEIVTYEELNLKRPSEIFTILHEVASKKTK